MSILMLVVLICGWQGVSNVAEAVTVPKDPSFSEFWAADWDDEELFEELKARATRLCAGLEFPRDTFAINDEFTILVAHTAGGKGLVIQGRITYEVGGDIQLGWLTLKKRDDLRVLTHYAPSGENVSCDISTEPEVPVVDPEPEVLVVDPDSPPIYWINADKIQRVNLDGSNIEDLVTGLSDPSDIALDVAGDKMYWTDGDVDKIQRANLDGSNVEDLVTQGLENPSGIALDVAGGKMYWTDPLSNKLQRANLDGSNVEDLVTGLGNPTDIELDIAGGKIYWTDWGTKKLQRANLDGSNVEDLVTQGLRITQDIALDIAGGKIYWTDFGTGRIQRANLDGSNVEDLIIQGFDSLGDITLDVPGSKMYWTDWGTNKLQRANLDGSNVEDIVTGLETPVGIALAIPPQVTPTPPPTPIPTPTVSISPATIVSPDVGKQITFSLNITEGNDVKGFQANVIYDSTALRYVESAIGDYLPADAYFEASVSAANTLTLFAVPDTSSMGDGTLATITFEVVEVKASTLLLADVLISDSQFMGVVPELMGAEITEPEYLREDVNKDGVVNILDLTFVASNFGARGENVADVNGDGIVNILDLTMVASAFGKTASAPDIWSLKSDEIPARATVEAWLNEARMLNLTDPDFQRGIFVLENLLKWLVPKQTALLANYPNPFNPETWIPYQLSEDADVMLHIYAIDGTLVRTLLLGHQAAGVYQNRSRAAYWDGRNAFGEKVASGVYFYTLMAGDFTATRKMLIRK